VLALDPWWQKTNMQAMMVRTPELTPEAFCIQNLRLSKQIGTQDEVQSFAC
jgi:hypothetical protein